jgi:hypothetical protein
VNGFVVVDELGGEALLRRRVAAVVRPEGLPGERDAWDTGYSFSIFLSYYRVNLDAFRSRFKLR